MAQGKDFTEADLFGQHKQASPDVTVGQGKGFNEADLFPGIVTPSTDTVPAIAPAISSVPSGANFSEQSLFGVKAPTLPDSASNTKDFQALLTLGDNPSLDKAPGFTSSLQKATVGLYDSAVRIHAKELSSWLVDVGKRNAPGSAFTYWAVAEQARQAKEDIWIKKFNDTRPDSKAYQQILADGLTVGERVNVFLDSKDKWTAVKELIGGSTPGSLAMVAGFSISGAPGVFAASGISSWGDDYMESKRLGLSDAEARDHATTKALLQGGFDALAFIVPAKVELSNKFADIFFQTTMQGVLGASAEAGKHVAVGEPVSGGAVFANFVGEFVGAPVEIVTSRGNGKKTSQQKHIEEILSQVNKIKETSDIKTKKLLIKDLQQQLSTRQDKAFVADVPLTNIQKKNADGTTRPLTAAELQDVTTKEAGSTVTPEEEMAITVATTVETGNGTDSLANVNWKETPVVAAEETTIKGILRQLALESASKENELAAAQQLTPEKVPGIEQELRHLQEQESSWTKKREEHQRFTNKTLGILNDWVATFAPDMKVILSDGQVGFHASKARMNTVESLWEGNKYATEDAYKAARHWAEGFNIKSERSGSVLGQHFTMPSGVSVIEVDTAFTNSFKEVNTHINYNETVAHEFGHALINHVYDNLDLATRVALVNGYRKWLKRLAAAKTNEEFYKIHGGVAKVDILGNGDKVNIRRGKERYTYGMNEYLANQMTKALGNNKLVGTPVEGFFKRVLKTLREFYTKNKQYMPETSFTDFINGLALDTTMREIRAAEASGNVDTQEKVLSRATETIAAVMSSSHLVDSNAGTVKRGSYGKEEFKADLDNYNTTLGWGLTLLQIGKLNPHIVGLMKYIDLIKAWWNAKTKQTERADERLKQWNDLGADRGGRVGAFMQDLTVLSYNKGERYQAGDVEWEGLVKKHKMDNEMLAMADLIDNDFKTVMIDLEKVQRDNIERTITDDVERAAALQKLDETFKALSQKNFFPLSRFGDQFMRVKAERDMVYDGVEYKAGETLTFETFEKEDAMLTRQMVFKDKSKYIVEGGLLNDTQKQFAGFPPQFLTALQERLDLTDQQRAEFESLIHDLAPGKSFTKHMMTRKNTPGYSTDGIRSYANYFLHFGNYVSRIKYKDVLQDAINEVGDSAKIIGQQTGNSTKRTKIQRYMQEHYEVTMNPGNELANLRALGFLWYLGFVPKSALVNLTQVPLVTYPFLAARYGDVLTIQALVSATQQAATYWRNPSKLKNGQRIMIETLVESGLLDESLATELAAQAEGSLLARFAPGTAISGEKASRAIRNMAGKGAWMFQKAEMLNRRVTALAAYNLAVNIGADHVTAVEAARDAVENTQYEYAMWNRPKFSQGKKSALFLFWQYMQNSMFFVAKDPGSMRYLAMMFLFAGASGEPFAEDAMDLFDYIAKKLNKQFGEDFAPNNIRLAAREFIKELGMNPDLVMHGSSRYSFGVSKVGDLLGLPIPNADMSGSLSMGHIIPGFSAMLGDGGFNKGFAQAAEQAGGAVLAMPIQLMRAIADDNPDTLKRFERAMPSFAKSLSKAYRFAARGEDKLPDGTVITKFNINDNLQAAEIAAQALGFTPTRVARAKEAVYLTKEIVNYYALRRASFIRLLDYAKVAKDKTLWEGVWVEAKKFNKTLRKNGLGGMSIRPGSIRSGLLNRAKHRQLQAKGIIGGKAGVAISKKVYDAFEVDEIVP